MYYEEEQLASYSDAAREYACNYGADHPEKEWILTDYDTWEKNPWYTGQSGTHPEDYPD